MVILQNHPPERIQTCVIVCINIFQVSHGQRRTFRVFIPQAINAFHNKGSGHMIHTAYFYNGYICRTFSMSDQSFADILKVNLEQ